MDPRRWFLLSLLAVGLVGAGWILLGGEDPSSGRPPPRDVALPGVMAAIGDSITQAAASGRESTGNSPEDSWSTGERIDSHATRLRDAGVAVSAHNDSVSGARMRDAPAQAELAAGQQAEYVTFLMGANDACAPSAAQVTPVAEFEADLGRALRTLDTAPAQPHVLVSSIPNLRHLWELFKDDIRVTTLWDSFGICPTMLSSSITDGERDAVVDRIEAYNAALQRGCDAVTRCRHDAGVVYRHRFERADVSDLDYFHPSVSGQETLARLTWKEGFWPDL
jgi:lysophospholipase L1-like esterase